MYINSFDTPLQRIFHEIWNLFAHSAVAFCNSNSNNQSSKRSHQAVAINWQSTIERGISEQTILLTATGYQTACGNISLWKVFYIWLCGMKICRQFEQPSAALKTATITSLDIRGFSSATTTSQQTFANMFANLQLILSTLAKLTWMRGVLQILYVLKTWSICCSKCKAKTSKMEIVSFTVNEWGNDLSANTRISMTESFSSRYNAGFYFFHPLFQDVEYSWRVEPGTHYTCDLQSDPFQRMKQGDKTLGAFISSLCVFSTGGRKMKYSYVRKHLLLLVGFIQTQQQPPITMRNFWGIVDQFIHQFSGHVLPSNRTIMPWLKDASDEYNFCHIWSTSEIVDLSFLRSQVYQAFFSYLDSTGGFFYERYTCIIKIVLWTNTCMCVCARSHSLLHRWGDGAVQTAAAALFLDRDELLFLNDVGHSYAERTHCPPSLRHMEHCSCEVASNLGKLYPLSSSLSFG